jgi:hypothetical protein
MPSIESLWGVIKGRVGIFLFGGVERGKERKNC